MVLYDGRRDPLGLLRGRPTGEHMRARATRAAATITCSVLVAEAHAARIDGVEQDGQWGEVWHAGQAFDMLMSLHYVCMFAREQGIIAPPRSTSRNFTHTSGGRHPVN